MSTPSDHDHQQPPPPTPGPIHTVEGHALYRAAARLFANRDVQTVLQHIVRAAQTIAGAGGAAILLYDGATAQFVPAVPSVALGLDENWLQGQRLDAAQSLELRTVETRDVVEVLDTAAVPGVEVPLLAGARRPGAVSVTPLAVEGTVVGVLALYHADRRVTPLDHSVLRSLAALAGLAMVIARAHEREHAVLARLEALSRASTELAAERSLDRVLQRIVEVATRLAGARYGALGIAGPDDYLSDFITTGLSAAERARIGQLPRGHGLLGVLIRHGQPLRIPNIAHDPRRVGFPPHHPPMTSLLGVPIRVRDEVVGDLYLTDKIGAPEFSEDDQQVIEMLAAHAGVVIENARLYTQVRQLPLLHERERLGRHLHDGIIQDIYAVILQVENLADDLPLARERLHGVAAQLAGVIRDVRTYIHGLRLRDLEGRLLSESLVGRVQEINERGDLTATFVVEGTPYRLPSMTADALLQIARDALSTVRARAAATQVHVRLAYAVLGVTLTITDNSQVGAMADAGDLASLRARAEEVGGALGVQHGPGSGTTITVFVRRDHDAHAPAPPADP